MQEESILLARAELWQDNGNSLLIGHPKVSNGRGVNNRVQGLEVIGSQLRESPNSGPIRWGFRLSHTKSLGLEAQSA